MNDDDTPYTYDPIFALHIILETARYKTRTLRIHEKDDDTDGINSVSRFFFFEWERDICMDYDGFFTLLSLLEKFW